MRVDGVSELRAQCHCPAPRPAQTRDWPSHFACIVNRYRVTSVKGERRKWTRQGANADTRRGPNATVPPAPTRISPSKEQEIQPRTKRQTTPEAGILNIGRKACRFPHYPETPPRDFCTSRLSERCRFIQIHKRPGYCSGWTCTVPTPDPASIKLRTTPC